MFITPSYISVCYVWKSILINYKLKRLIITVNKVAANETNVNERVRRYLLFPSGTQFGAYVTVSIPLHPESTTSVAWFFEANYYNVANATYFEPLLGDVTITRSRDERSVLNPSKNYGLTRSNLYCFIESMLEKHGYPGRGCLLRAICESATSHFLHNGILGDLLHLLLTPSASMLEEDLHDCYYEAEYNGLEENCQVYSQQCSEDPMEYISMKLEDFS